MIAQLRRKSHSQLNKWAKRRHGQQSSPQQLSGKRIYILPTKAGVVFSLMLFVMLIGSMNYNNNMGLTLTFLLASFMLVAMHQCHRNLLSLKVRFDDPAPVFAGQSGLIPVSLINEGSHRRIDLILEVDKHAIESVNLVARETQHLEIPVASPRRGLHQVNRLKIACRYPGGMFNSWTWIYWDISQLVYPSPLDEASLPAQQAGDGEGQVAQSRGDQEFEELRNYQAGDNLSRVAWKQLARNGELHSKSFQDNTDQDLWLDWQLVAHPDVEHRLSQLCQWVIDADQQKRNYGLRLDNLEIEPNTGAKHKQRCLTALAMYQ